MRDGAYSHMACLRMAYGGGVEVVVQERLNKVAVIGLGLIGASFAAAYKHSVKQGWVLGVDVQQSSCQTAFEKGWVDDTCKPEDETLREYLLDGCQLVVLATPASEAREYFEMLENWGYQGIITDTASTKSRICSDASAILSEPEIFIPGHPMAGSEVNGIEGARPDLFEGAHWILCPDENTDPERFTQLHELLVEMKERLEAVNSPLLLPVVIVTRHRHRIAELRL